MAYWLNKVVTFTNKHGVTRKVFFEWRFDVEINSFLKKNRKSIQSVEDIALGFRDYAKDEPLDFLYAGKNKYKRVDFILNK